MQIGDLRARLETESSRCIDLDAKNQVLQQELLSMKATERECEKLKQIKKNLEEKVVNLRSHAEVNVVQGIQVEKYYKWEIDQRVRLIVEERLKEVNLFFQVSLLICDMLSFISLQITLWLYALCRFPLLPLQQSVWYISGGIRSSL